MAQPRATSVESSVGDPTFKPSWAQSEERLSRRRSVECSATKISIPETELNQDHTVYIICVSTPLRSWTIKRRYRDFHYLDRELSKYFPNVPFPTLPPKRYLRSSSDPEIVDQRKEQLEQYLNSLVTTPQVWARNDFVLFLNDSSNIMTYIWNFERMRKLQEVLNSMKVSNETETAKLTDDLAVAAKQVKILQTRLSQMEMIFLQHATGMATAQLPTSVLRSLSNMETSLSSQLRSELKAEHAVLYQDKVATPMKDGCVEEMIGMNGDGSPGSHVPVEDVMKALNFAAEGNGAKRSPEEARAYAMSLQLQEAIHLSNQLLREKVDIALTPSPEKSKRPPSYDYHPSRKSPIISAKFVSNSSENKFHAADLSTSHFDANKTSLTGLDNWIGLMGATIDVILESVTPTEQSLRSRYFVFKYIRDLVSTTLGCQLFPTGSLLSHTFLPESGVDCTAFVPKLADDSWFVKINEALCLSAFSGSDGGADRVAVSNVSFVNDEIKMIRSMINNFPVTISSNQLTSIYAGALVERLNNFVGKNGLFKRSVLLLKAWFHFESARYTNGGGSLLGVKDDRLSSWSVVVLLTYIFNIKGNKITHPMQAMGHFFAYYSSFDWCSLIMTVKGPAFRTEDNTLAYITDTNAKSKEKLFPDEIFDFYRSSNSDYGQWHVEPELAPALSASVDDQQGSTLPLPAEASPTADTNSGVLHTDSLLFHPDYQFAQCNLINPIDRSSNLLLPIESIGLDSFISALHEGYKHYQSICEEMSKALSVPVTADPAVTQEKMNKLVRKFFANTCNKTGVDNFSKMTSFISGRQHDRKAHDMFAVSSQDLQFSLSYGQLSMGGKIDQALLLHLIIIILNKKGSMPVGEIGKNLQALLSCDNLSKRLKEQFGGLKKAIERSNFTELRMGTEHPFNPVVTLLGESPILAADQLLHNQPTNFGHAAFLFTPYAISLQLQSQAQKEAQLAQNKQQHKQHKKYNGYNSSSNNNNAMYQPSYQESMAHSPYGSYPPPFLAVPMGYPGGPYMDGSTPSPKRSGGQHSPPGHGMYYPAPGPHGPPGPPMPGMMSQGPMHSMPMPIPGPYPGMPPMYGGHGGGPMFAGPPMGYGGPGGPPPYYQMHNSLPGSLGSSYGGNPNMMAAMDNHGEQNL